MTWRVSLGVFCGAALLAQSSGTISAPPSGTLRVVSRGDVKVDGGERGDIGWTISQRARQMNCNVRATNTAALTTVTLDCPQGNRSAGDLQLQVPRNLKTVTVQTRGGRVEANNLAGMVDAQTGGGPIFLQNLASEVRAQTGGGEIRVGAVQGPVKAVSGGGSIRVESVSRESTFETAGGEVTVRHAKKPIKVSTAGGSIYVENAESDVHASTAGGVIEVQQAGGVVQADTSGGSIQIGSAKGVQCESAAGAIRLKNVSGALRAMTASGSILADLNGRLEESVLSTNNGDITVFLPSNFAVTVSVRNETRGQNRIVSEFPEIRVQNSGGSRRGPAVAEGSINGGGPVLRISASNGTIYLRRQR